MSVAREIRPEETSLRWFGLEKPVNHSWQGEVATPVGETCRFCLQPILDGDQGWTMPHWDGYNRPKPKPYHHDCLLRAITGKGADEWAAELEKRGE